jgi:hypothetical protein
MQTTVSTTRIGAMLYPPLAEAVDQLRAMGYSDAEIVRRGVRMVAKEEGIVIGGAAS